MLCLSSLLTEAFVPWATRTLVVIDQLHYRVPGNIPHFKLNIALMPLFLLVSALLIDGIALWRMHHSTGIVFLALLVTSILCAGTAHANGGSGRKTTTTAGAYTIDVTLSQDPSAIDQPLDISVTPHDATQHLSGQVVAKPGLGTDAANIYAHLNAPEGKQAPLTGSLRLPVQGAWQIVVELDGPHGHGEATINVVAAAPGAMPLWLAWYLGDLPALGLLLWSLYQRSYRKKLVFSFA